MTERGSALGDLAIVLHSHMPYVEGFGTYPFGEEWLFDAVACSYLPVLERAHDLTVTVSPVLADQLEARGVADRLGAFVGRYRLDAAERDASDAPEDLRPAATAEAARYRRAPYPPADLGGEPPGPVTQGGPGGEGAAVPPPPRPARRSPAPPPAG